MSSTMIYIFRKRVQQVVNDCATGKILVAECLMRMNISKLIWFTKWRYHKRKGNVIIGNCVDEAWQLVVRNLENAGKPADQSGRKIRGWLSGTKIIIQ